MNFYEIFQAHLKFFSSKIGSLIMHIYILYKANSIFFIFTDLGSLYFYWCRGVV
jgi:hypothetical protein